MAAPHHPQLRFPAAVHPVCEDPHVQKSWDHHRESFTVCFGGDMLTFAQPGYRLRLVCSTSSVQHSRHDLLLVSVAPKYRSPVTSQTWKRRIRGEALEKPRPPVTRLFLGLRLRAPRAQQPAPALCCREAARRGELQVSSTALPDWLESFGTVRPYSIFPPTTSSRSLSSDSWSSCRCGTCACLTMPHRSARTGQEEEAARTRQTPGHGSGGSACRPCRLAQLSQAQDAYESTRLRAAA
eukprot:768681-Hanusia_phi.AAC.7